MTVQQELPTSSMVTEVPNADGTITRTLVNEYKDGTRRTAKEVFPGSDTTPQIVQALPVNPSPSAPSWLYATDVEGQHQQPYSATPYALPTTSPILIADGQQPSSPPRSKKIPPVPSNILTRISILFVVLGSMFGISAGVYTYLSQTEDSDNYDEEDGKKGQLAGAVAIFLFLLATPFMFFSGKLYRMKRASKGRPGFVMASWIIFGFALAYAGGLLFLAVEVEDYVQPMWVFAAVGFNLIPFLLMMIHAEAARTR